MMPTPSWTDIERAFLDALDAAGLTPAGGLDLIADGRIHRFTVEGDKRRSDNGWYVLFDGEPPAGAFGSWKTGQNEDWHLASRQEMTSEERKALKARMREAARQREAETKRLQEEAAAKARNLWEGAKPAYDSHPYLQSKRCKVFGLRSLGEQLMVPVRNAQGQLASVQFIDADGAKRFLTGSEKRGNYCAIGKPEGVLCVAEGYATGATILEATGYAVAVAFDAGNLLPVAEAMRKKFPALRIILCADNDQWTTLKRDGQEIPNPGVTLATEAARAVRGSVAVPAFTEEQIAAFEAEHGKRPTDWNDLALIAGIDAVREAIAGERANVADIGTAVRRREFEQLITDLDDPEGAEALAKLIRESDLTDAAKHRLYSMLAKRTGYRFSDLRRAAALEPPPADEGEPDFIDELNARHAVVPFGGRVSILSIEHDPLLSRRVVRFYDQSSFDLLYSNRSHRGFPITEAWLRSPSRRNYRGVVFAPSSDVPADYFNLWTGWGVEPLPAGVPLPISRFLDFLGEQIADGSDPKLDYLLKWIAHLFQRPCELPEVALVLRSGEGTGKNTLVDTLALLVGQAHYVVLSSVAQVTGQFSGHLADALLVFANEAIWGGDKAAQGSLKAMISDGVLPVERKGKDLITMPNYKRLIFASNEQWVVPRGLDDRRFAVFDVSEKHKQDEPYFAAVREEMAGPDFLPGLMRYFLDLDLSGWHPRRMPAALKSAGWDMKYQSGDSIMQWWLSCLDNAEINRPYRRADEGDSMASSWVEDIPKIDLHKAYLAWCEAHKVTRPKQDYLFGKEIKRYGVSVGPRSRVNGRAGVYLIPPLDQARALFSAAVGLPVEHWEEGQEALEAPESDGSRHG